MSFSGWVSSLNPFSIIEPEFCFKVPFVNLCRYSWYAIEMTGIILIIYYIIIKKREGKV